MSTPAEDFDARMLALGELIEEIERTCPPEAVEPARELIRALLAVHGSGLRVLIAQLEGAGAGRALRAACEEPAVASLLEMHDLHVQPAEPALIPATRLIARIGADRS